MNMLASVQDLFKPAQGDQDVKANEEQAAPVVTPPAPLPYDPAALQWNAQHTQNAERKYCYCGKDRAPDAVAFVCTSCRNWFHQGCVEVETPPTLVPFFTSYRFECRHCNWRAGTVGETFAMLAPPTWKECARVALANLTYAAARTTTPDTPHYFTIKEMVDFIAEHWEPMRVGRDKLSNWPGSVSSTVYSAGGQARVIVAKPDEQRSFSSAYGLVEADLYDIVPLVLNGLARGEREGSKRTAGGGGPGVAAKRAKRTPSAPSIVSGSAGGRSLLPYAKPTLADHIFNRNGFRYTDAEPDPFGVEVDDFRPAVQSEERVLMSLQDRAVQLRLSDDRLTVFGDKGYCMARATHYVGPGTWYCEMTVLESDSPDAHVRLGWSQALGALQGPCGADVFSYSYADKTGNTFHRSRGHMYGEMYSAGDVIGLLLHMPTAWVAELYRGKAKTIAQAMALARKPPPAEKEKEKEKGGEEGAPEEDLQMKVIDYKGLTYIEDKEDRDAAAKALAPVMGSKIVFYKNGVSQGVAFENISAGEYAPAVSLYMGAAVTVNFGPDFLYPPHGIGKGASRADSPRIRHQAMCEAAIPALAGVVLADIVGKAASGKWCIRSNVAADEPTSPAPR